VVFACMVGKMVEARGGSMVEAHGGSCMASVGVYGGRCMVAATTIDSRAWSRVLWRSVVEVECVRYWLVAGIVKGVAWRYGERQQRWRRRYYEGTMEVYDGKFAGFSPWSAEDVQWRCRLCCKGRQCLTHGGRVDYGYYV